LKYLLLLSFIFLFSRVSIGQIVYKDNGTKTDSVELRSLYIESIQVLDSINGTGLKIERLDIIEIGNDKYLLPNGAMSVYKWRNNKWLNLYKGANRGFNYGNHAFTHKGKIYCWGGYGFWHSHGMVIVFQEDLGEWELLPFTSDLEFMYGWQTKTGLHGFNNLKSIDLNIDDQHIRETTGHFLMEIPVIEPLHWNSLDFENYYYFYEKAAILIDKRTGESFESKLTPFRAYEKNGKGMFRIFGDSATYFKGDMDHRFDLSVRDEIKFLTKVSIVPKKSNPWLLIVSLFAIASLFSLVILHRQKRKINLNTTIETPINWNNKYLDALLLQIGTTLTADELDTILEIIDVVPAETQRFKRSNCIKDINRLYRSRHAQDLIIRKQDVEDGRKYVYQIGEV